MGAAGRGAVHLRQCVADQRHRQDQPIGQERSIKIGGEQDGSGLQGVPAWQPAGCVEWNSLRLRKATLCPHWQEVAQILREHPRRAQTMIAHLNTHQFSINTSYLLILTNCWTINLIYHHLVL